MLYPIIFITLFYCATLTLSSAIAPRTSNSACTYTCPSSDGENFPVGTDAGDQTNSNGVLFCSFPVNHSEDPNDFFCTYSDSTGALITAHDFDVINGNLCPASAPCVKQSKRSKRAVSERKGVAGKRAAGIAMAKFARKTQEGTEAVKATEEV